MRMRNNIEEELSAEYQIPKRKEFFTARKEVQLTRSHTEARMSVATRKGVDVQVKREPTK